MERGDPGFELGAASINAIITLGVLVGVGGIAVAANYPDVAVGPLIALLGGVAIVLPVLAYPFSFTIWFAIELVMDPPSQRALDDASERKSTVLPQDA